jgi:hypothetical protein
MKASFRRTNAKAIDSALLSSPRFNQPSNNNMATINGKYHYHYPNLPVRLDPLLKASFASVSLDTNHHLGMEWNGLDHSMNRWMGWDERVQNSG